VRGWGCKTSLGREWGRDMAGSLDANDMDDALDPKVDSDPLQSPLLIERWLNRKVSDSRVISFISWTVIFLYYGVDVLERSFGRVIWNDVLLAYISPIILFIMSTWMNMNCMRIATGWLVLFYGGFILLIQLVGGYVLIGWDLPVHSLIPWFATALFLLFTLISAILALIFGAELDATIWRFGKRIVGRS